MKRIITVILAMALLFPTLLSDVWSAVSAFEQLALVAGDITGDGKVNIADVAGLYAHVRGTKPQTGEDVTVRCDITGDGRVNIADVSKLYARIRGNVEYDDLLAYAEKVQKVQTPSTLTLNLMSDVHYCGHDPKPQTEKLTTANKMAMLSHYLKVDAAVNLGDHVVGNEEKEKTIEDLETLLAATGQNAKCPVFYVRGNHDDNGWYSREEDGYPGTDSPDEIIDHAQWHQLAFGANAKDAVIDSNNPTGGYGYFDHEASKIRVFLLNTSDIPYVLEEDGSYRYNAYECMAFSNAQLNFVANALKFADKETPNDWAAMFLMHVPMDTMLDPTLPGYRFGAANIPVRGYIQMLSIIAAYRKGISYSFTGSINATSAKHELPEHFQVSVAADYSLKGCGDVIAFVNGHTHIDNASRKVGYEYSLSYGYTYLGVVGSDSFATMVVDREKSVVNVFKYGEGRGPSQSKDPVIIKDGKVLVANGEEEFGVNFAKDGQWTIPFRQFRPHGENLLEGVDPVALDGFQVPSLPAALKLDAETMLPETVIESKNFVISKPILLKQNTQYVIPNVGKSMMFDFHHTLLKRSGSLIPVKHGEEMIITGGQYTGCYALFVFDKTTYPDYQDFYIKEHVNSNVPPEPEITPPSGDGEGNDPDHGGTTKPIEGNLFNGMSDLWGDGYWPDVTATLNLQTLELSKATANSKYATSKAVQLKPNTVYEVSGSVVSGGLNGAYICAYHPSGTFNGTYSLSESDDCLTFTSKSSGGYVVFGFNKNIYPDFENFYIREYAPSEPEVTPPSGGGEGNDPEQGGSDVPEDPMQGNLFNGMSDQWAGGYLPDVTASLDLQTLELSGATVNSKWEISKAVPIKGNTTYAIPDRVMEGETCGVLLYAYHAYGGYNGNVTLSDGDGCKIFTSKPSDGYVVVGFYKNIYSDFENFYIKELARDDTLPEEDASTKIVGSMSKDFVISLNEALPTGRYTLRYEDAGGVMENCRDICTLEKTSDHSVPTYGAFIAQNKAPAGAERIGVCDETGKKVGIIALQEAFKNRLDTKQYSFSAMSDVHLGYSTAEADFQKALEYFDQTEKVDLNMICGDLAVNGTESELQNFRNLVDACSGGVETYVAAGNHEEYAANSSTYFEQYAGNPLYFYFKKGDDVFIVVGVMGTHENRLFEEGELQWLYEVLEENRNNRCFLFQHIPVEGSSGDPLNALQGKTTKLANEKSSVAFKNLLSHYKNVIHFHGHTHFQLASQEYDRKANYDNGFGIHSVHIPSLSNPRAIDPTGASVFLGVPQDAEGYVVDVYEGGILLRGMDLNNERLIPVAQYYLDTTVREVAAGTFVDSTGIINTAQ